MNRLSQFLYLNSRCTTTAPRTKTTTERETERMETAHDWRTVREHLHADGLLQVQHCRRCDAGRTTTTDHETGARRIIATYPDPSPSDCPGTQTVRPDSAVVRPSLSETSARNRGTRRERFAAPPQPPAPCGAGHSLHPTKPNANWHTETLRATKQAKRHAYPPPETPFHGAGSRQRPHETPWTTSPGGKPQASDAGLQPAF